MNRWSSEPLKEISIVAQAQAKEAEKSSKVEAKALIDRTKTIEARKRHYECIFIFSPAMDEAAVTALLGKAVAEIEKNDGEMLRKDDWGKMRMAYEIEKHAQGRYFYVRYIAPIKAIAAFERILKLDANCLRFQTVKLSDDLSSQEIQDLIQKAPNEVPKAPNVFEEEDYS